MTDTNKRVIRNCIIVILCLVAARLIRYIDLPIMYSGGVGFFLIFSIYMFLLVAWALSVIKRITDRHIRRYLLLSDAAMVFWFFARSMHHTGLEGNEPAIRMAWYLYYLAMITIAQCALWLSLSIGRGENYKLDRRWHIATFISVFLLLGVLTNDFHELAFGVFEGTTHPAHGPFFYGIVGWIGIMTLFAVGRIYYCYSDRRHRSKLIYVCLILFFGVGYLIMDMLGVFEFKIMEFTAAFCGLTIALWECMIQTGMIPSNTDYDWCIRNSSVHASILNMRGDVVYSSRDVYPIDENTFLQLRRSNILMTSADTELHLDEIYGGFTAWEKSVKEEKLLLSELENQKKNLVDANRVLGENIEAEGRHEQLKARNRLYDLVISRIDHQIAEIRKRLEILPVADENSFLNILGEINIIGVYIKRKSNLILVEEMQSTDLGRELKLCFKETFDTLNRAGVEADYHFREIPVINIDVALILYDFLETVIEYSMGRCDKIFSIVTDGRAETAIMVSVVLRNGLSENDGNLSKAFEGWEKIVSEYYEGQVTIENSPEEFTVRLKLVRGGGTDDI